MSPKSRFNITLDPDHIAFLRVLQKLTGASASEHIRRAIEQYVVSQAKVLGPMVTEEKRRRAEIAAVEKAKASRKKSR